MMKKIVSDNLVQMELIQPLLDLLEDGVVVHDERRQISLVNSATEKITGRSRDEIIGKDCHIAFPPDGICGAGCSFRDGASRELKVGQEHTVPFSRADGKTMQIKVRSHPILIGGKKRNVLLVIRDVTEVSDLRWQLKRRQSFHGMIGTSPKITEVFEVIRVVGASEYPVLITGESGTGKELAAFALHK
ncbi:PAS domain S-box protein, partial [bacterium]|nr:PAS domain S-box protein [bacterium]